MSGRCGVWQQRGGIWYTSEPVPSGEAATPGQSVAGRRTLGDLSCFHGDNNQEVPDFLSFYFLPLVSAGHRTFESSINQVERQFDSHVNDTISLCLIVFLSLENGQKGVEAVSVGFQQIYEKIS